MTIRMMHTGLVACFFAFSIKGCLFFRFLCLHDNDVAHRFINFFSSGSLRCTSSEDPCSDGSYSDTYQIHDHMAVLAWASEFTCMCWLRIIPHLFFKKKINVRVHTHPVGLQYVPCSTNQPLYVSKLNLSIYLSSQPLYISKLNLTILGQPSRLDRVLVNLIRGLLVCGPCLFL